VEATGLAASVHEHFLPMVTSSAPHPIGPPIPDVDPLLLAEAFSSFTEAAASLEHSYGQLQAEVTRLRRELGKTNRDLVRTLEENQLMRERLNRILQALPCGVVAIETDGRVTMANPEACRLLGARTNFGLPGWMHELLTHVHPGGSELEYRPDAGGEWIAIRRAELSGEAGASSIFIVEDISGLKRLESEHEVLRRRQALAEMSATLAHEIRNPLGSLELFAGLLSESEMGDEEQGWVRHLQAGLRTLAATVNNVLHFYSQPQPGLTPVDLGEVLGSLAQFLRPQAEAAQVKLELKPSFQQARVAADRHRVEQVLLNLALNAFRFMPHGGVLKISGQTQMRDGGPKAMVEIADTGPGIPPENAERIFQPGFTTRPGSPGLGLAVSRTIMEQHGGTIRVLPSSGGARFELEFPVLRSGQ